MISLDSRHEFPEQDMLVPWRLQKRFFLPGQSGSGSGGGVSSSSSAGADGDERTSLCMTVATTKKLPSKSGVDGSNNGFQPKKQRRKKKSKRPLIPKTEGDTIAIDEQIAVTVIDAKMSSDPLSDGDDSESVDPAATDLETEEIDVNVVDNDGELSASVQELELSTAAQPPTDDVLEQEQSSASSTAAVSSVVAALSTVSPDGPCEHMIEDEQKVQVIHTNHTYRYTYHVTAPACCSDSTNIHSLINLHTCLHVQLIFQRYCHVYKEGELEELCQSVPGCEIVETGWDKGNWTVLLHKNVGT